MRLHNQFIMRSLFISSLNLATISFVSAQENSYCQSKLFEQLRVTSTETVKTPQRKPTGILKDYVDRYEYICPWQLEKDFNGDGKNDWAGFVYRNDQYELIVYLSNELRYTTKQIKTYRAFPKRTFLRVLDSSRLDSLTNNQTIKYQFDNALEVHELSGKSNVYAWINNDFKIIYSYSSEITNKLIEEKQEELPNPLHSQPDPYR
ncbi:hypothetical protein [Aliikangiella maris]|uniref:Uncharacterized protein n=2 Tax=Aliikangiella maris TaxID=3162458 RepID=A0ABV3MIT2_9GAMM